MSDFRVPNADPAARYTVLEELGRGSFGVVYKAIDRETGETVAIKHIDLEASNDDIEDIQAEITLLSTCASPHVTKYHTSFTKGSKLWIVMEYLGGGSCHDLLMPDPGVFTEAQIAVICRELLHGLVYLHAGGKIHRDIKAANVLLSDDGKVKLADFGVAAQLNTMATNRHTFVGTPFWMSPEVIRAENGQNGYHNKADIWSLGITVIEMARGEPPHSDKAPMKALFEIERQDSPRLQGPFSKEMKDFVKQCLMKHPDERPSAKTLLSHRFVRSAGKVESLLELINRKRRWDATRTRKLNRAYYQETMKDLSPKDEQDEWVFDTVKSIAPDAQKAKLRKPPSIFSTEETFQRMDINDAPLQLSPQAPATVRRTMRRQMSIASTRGNALRRPLQPDLSFGNNGSSQRLFKRVPSDGSNSGRISPSPFDENPDENKHPIAAPANSKEARLGRRLYTKALEPTLSELHAQTSNLAKREALAKLSDAFAALDSVDPEGAYHLLRNLNASIAEDTKLSSAFLSGTSSTKGPIDSDTPQGTVIIKSAAPANPQLSPTKLVLADSNPHLKSHRRRQSALCTPTGSPQKVSRQERDVDSAAEKSALQSRYPGQMVQPGMEHCQQVSDQLYSRWIDGLRARWPGK
ncbi:Pkinase-domain-containing protein [Xylariaceae sp. FL1272]|nr:Pkinase-domain-containing protein [Xylariaceae sp. FL1272]